ncbi:MAG: outer rane autotransporter barrel domain protein [Hyphomicrobiales bacterium]|nr:outer rane autotransporter barrel domain protein [Hyphomicrobiales bacterium]
MQQVKPVALMALSEAVAFAYVVRIAVRFKTMKLVGKLGLALIVSSSSFASAADLPARAAPPVFAAVPVSSWAGFYAGTFFAGSSTRFDSSSLGASRSVSKSSHAAGLLAGYNFQSGAYIFGIEGDISQNYAKGENAGTGALVPHSALSLQTAHLRGRLGYDMGAFLPFVAGGLSYFESAISVPAGIDIKGANGTGAGWNIGAGIDWKVPLPILGETILRAEYIYENLPSRGYSYNPALPAIDMKSNSHQIRAALIYTPTVRGWRAPQMEAADWSGAYAGFLAGYGKDRVRTSTALASRSFDADGGLGGIYAGRNFVFGNVIAGWDGAIMLSSLNGDGIVPGTLDAHSYRDYFTSDIRGRVGYAFGRFLPFIAAGATFGRSEQSDAVTLSHRAKISTDAWTIGAGVDYMLMDRVSMRVEYLHQKSWNNTDVDLNGVAMSQSRSADSVRAGLAWHFH